MAIDPIKFKKIVAPKKFVNVKTILNNENFVCQLSITIVGD
jgi:hypothetical protein